MSPAEVEDISGGTVVQEKGDPGDRPAGKVRAHHRPQSPMLQVSALDPRIEDGPAPGGRQPHPEIDVLHRLDPLVEAAHAVECLSSYCPDARPERARFPARRVMDV